MYDTYRFKDKDPIIDICRTCVEIYATLHNLTFSKAITSLSRSSNVSEGCMWGWFAGNTRYPRFATIVAVVHATGREVKVGNQSLNGRGSKPRFKSIKGGKAAAA